MTTGRTSLGAGGKVYSPAWHNSATGNTPRTNVDGSDAVLAAVDFKWLMAGRGWHVEIARLQADPAYAAHILGLAIHSGSPALRDCAASLSTQIEIGGRRATGDRTHASAPA